MSYSTVVSFTGNDASTLSIELGNSTAGSVIVELRDPSAAHQVMKRIVLEAGETAKVLNFSSRGLFLGSLNLLFAARRMTFFKACSLEPFIETTPLVVVPV